MTSAQGALERALALPVWSNPGNAEILGGGITNNNVKLTDGGKSFVVRVADDIPLHQVMRFNELACHRASEAVGLSPSIVYSEPGILVMDFVEGRVLSAQAARAPAMAERILTILKTLHRDACARLRGPVLMFWVFDVLRDYAATLRDAGTIRRAETDRFMSLAERLEAAVGPVDIVLSHNDLLPANLIDAGDRLWLIDWDYGGLNSPLFDLAGLASNCGYSEPDELALLEKYYEAPVTAGLWRRYSAMKCAALLRETMWSMVSEIHSTIDFDYATYTAENRARFEAALSDFQSL